MIYNWQQPDWPNFRYELTSVLDVLLSIAEKAGQISGKLTHLSTGLQTETMINLMVEEAIKTSEIEGEYISRPDVRSSIKNKLGLNQNIAPVHDKRAQGVVDMMFDVRSTFKQPLTEEKLFEWHLMLMSANTNPELKVGFWRTHKEPMQIVSGHHGNWVVHFEAPPSPAVPKEMKQFINWFNDTAPGGAKEIKFAPIRAAVAHLYFESIHPFEDGNGRIGRAISEKALSQGFGYPVMLSLSQAIEANKKAYYAALNTASKSNEITDWVSYFVKIILDAQTTVEKQINFIVNKSILLDNYESLLNERELKVVRRMLDAGIEGFEGGMHAKKYMKLTGVSKATATRDLQHLSDLGIFKQIGDGRNIHYEINFLNTASS
ncbi:MAG TPA: Fic family protein [Gammaproteobacteria bacterium]|nr:Fic family protein [Gammaproteobacteria bacterium]